LPATATTTRVAEESHTEKGPKLGQWCAFSCKEGAERRDGWVAVMSTPAVCSALYILDGSFKTLLSRDWRGDTSPTHVERFVSKLAELDSESDQRPIMEDEEAKVTYVYIQHNNLYLLALTRNNANAVALLTFLHHLVEIFVHYFKVPARASPA